MPDGVLDWSEKPPRVLHPRDATRGAVRAEVDVSDIYRRRAWCEYVPETMSMRVHYEWVDPNSGIVVGYGETFQRA